MEMRGITRGSLGWLTITVLVLVVISSTTAGEEQLPAQVHQGPPALHQRVLRATGEKKVKKNNKKKNRKKKNGQASKKKKRRSRKLDKKSKKATKNKRGRKLKGRKRNKDKKVNKKRNKNKGKGRKKKTKRNRRRKTKKDKKKRKKGKRKNKKKRRKGKWTKKRKIQSGQSSSCQNISCLNNLLQVLKIDKDTVQNFMQQKKRIDKKLSLATNKQGKSNVTGSAMASLQKSLGGADALKNNRPVCHGRYNITDAIQGQIMYNNISQCDALIKTACNFSMPANETAEVEACNKVMGDFR